MLAEIDRTSPSVDADVVPSPYDLVLALTEGFVLIYMQFAETYDTYLIELGYSYSGM